MTHSGATGSEGNTAAALARARLILGGVVAAAFLLRLWVAWMPLETLVTQTMPDDGFYYLQIARHIAAGDGITFDGTEPTNGFHPLWMALLVPVFRLAGPDGARGVHLALTLAAMLDVGTMVVLARTVRRITGTASAGLVAVLWYAANPAIVTQVANGLETSLNLLCLSGLFACVVYGRQANVLSTRWWVFFGCVAGLTMLARSDNVVPVIVVGAALCTFPWRPARVRGLAVAVAVSVVWQAPWLWWNWTTSGRLLQTSAGAYSVVTRGNLAAEGYGTGTVLWYAVRDTYTWFVRTLPLDLAGESKIVGVVAGVLIAVLAYSGGRRVVDGARACAAPALACVALLLANTLLRGTAKPWYAAPAALIMAYGAGLVWQVIAQGDGSLRARRIAAVLLGGMVATGYIQNGVMLATRSLFPWQAELLAGGEWLRDHTPADTVAGAFNSGIVGYVAERPVVNLDGLVNTAAADAVRDRRLGAYVHARDIGVIVDYRYSVFTAYDRFYGPDWDPREQLSLVQEFTVPDGAWAGTHVGAYRVRPGP